MNKRILFGLLALLFVSIKGTMPDCDKEDEVKEFASSHGEEMDGDFCSLFSTSGTKTHCCYIKKGAKAGNCIGITDDEYENIKRYKKYVRGQGDEDFSIDCASKFISISLLAALALLF